MEFFSFSDPGWANIEDRQKLFSSIDPIDGALKLGEHVSLSARDLPIYEGVRLLCLTSKEWEEDLRVCYLTYEDELFRLNGTSPPIHNVNARAPVKLTTENVLYYLTFFCFFVRGEEGPFYLLHNFEDSILPNDFFDVRSLTKPSAPSPRQFFRPPRLAGNDDNSNWRASALVYYSNALFFADFLIQPTGMVDMMNDEPLLPELPCRIKAPLTVDATGA